MASIRRGYSDDFVIKNNKVGIGTSNPQENLDVVGGALQGQDLKVTGVSTQTAFSGFLRADHQIAENTEFSNINVSSLSGEIIVGTGVTVTIDNLPDGDFGPELITNGTFDSDTTGWTANNAVLTSTSNQLKVDDTANAGGWSSASQEVTTEPGAKYRWEVTIGSSTDGSFIGYNAGRYTAGNAPTKSYGEFSGGQTTAIEFIAPEKITTIVLVANNDGVSYYDNVSLKKINVPQETRAGGSQIDTLKVYNTFTPPSGDTNQRPYAPKPGELYYNYDFMTIEFFDGNGWRQVDNTTRSGRMIFSQGNSPTNAVGNDFIQSTTLGNAVYFGDLSASRAVYGGAGSDGRRGIFAGGYNYNNTIDYVTIASAGTAVNFGDLSKPSFGNAMSCSSTRAVIYLGYTNTPATGAVNIIDYIEISTTGNALDFGDHGNTVWSGVGAATPTRGIYGSSASATGLQHVTIASKGNAVTFGKNAIEGAWGQGTASSNSISMLISNQLIGTRCAVTKTNIASLGRSIVFGDLTKERHGAGSGSNSTRTLFAGGNDPSPATHNIIDYFTITTSGNAIDFGDLSALKRNTAGCSDSHGGLGGF